MKRAIIILKAESETPRVIVGKRGKPVDLSAIPQPASFDDHPGGQPHEPFRSNVLKFTSRLKQKMADKGRSDYRMPVAEFHNLALNSGLTEDELAMHGMHRDQLMRPSQSMYEPPLATPAGTADAYHHRAQMNAPSMRVHSMGRSYASYTNPINLPHSQYYNVVYHYKVQSGVPDDVRTMVQGHFGGDQRDDYTDTEVMHERGWNAEMPNGKPWRILYEIQSDPGQGYPGRLRANGMEHHHAMPTKDAFFADATDDPDFRSNRASRTRDHAGKFLTPPILSHPIGKRDTAWDTEEALPLAITRAIYDGMKGISLPSPRMYNGNLLPEGQSPAKSQEHIANRYGTTLPAALQRIQQAYGGTIRHGSLSDLYTALHPSHETFPQPIPGQANGEDFDRMVERISRHPEFRKAMNELAEDQQTSVTQAIARGQRHIADKFWDLVERGVIPRVEPSEQSHGRQNGDVVPFPMSSADYDSMYEDLHDQLEHTGHYPMRVKTGSTERQAEDWLDGFNWDISNRMPIDIHLANGRRTAAPYQTTRSDVYDMLPPQYQGEYMIRSPYDWHRQDTENRTRREDKDASRNRSNAKTLRAVSHSEPFQSWPSMDWRYVMDHHFDFDDITNHARRELEHQFNEDGQTYNGSIHVKVPIWMNWLLRRHGVDPSELTYVHPISHYGSGLRSVTGTTNLVRDLNNRLNYNPEPPEADAKPASNHVPVMSYEFPQELIDAVLQHGHSPGQGLEAFLKAGKHNRRLIKAVDGDFDQLDMML